MTDEPKPMTAAEIQQAILILKAQNWDDAQHVGELSRMIAEAQQRVNIRDEQIKELTRQLPAEVVK